MRFEQADLVNPEVLDRIRAENQVLLEATSCVRASLETGRFDEAAPMAAKLGEVLRSHVSLVDGVLDVLTLDDTLTKRR